MTEELEKCSKFKTFMFIIAKPIPFMHNVYHSNQMVLQVRKQVVNVRVHYTSNLAVMCKTLFKTYLEDAR